MNFGYGDILDYLLSSNRDDLAMAIKLDMGYIIEKTFKKATPAEKSMMTLDFILNHGKENHQRISKGIAYYAGEEVLSSSICGIPLIEFAKRFGNVEAIEMFSGIILPEEAEFDESIVTRITEMFRIQLAEKPEMLNRGLNFIKRECFSPKNPDDIGPHI